MALLTLRDEKGIPLTHQEMDANLRNLNAEGVTGGNAHDHTTGNGAPIPYNSLTGKPTLGTAAAQNVEAFEASGAVGTHEAAADPHPGYALESSLGTAATQNVEAFEPSGAVSSHVAAADPHNQYLKESGGFILNTVSGGGWGSMPLIIEHDSGVQPGIGFHAEAVAAAGILKFYGPTASFEVRSGDDAGFVNLRAADLYSNGNKIIELTTGPSGIAIRFSNGVLICLCSYPASAETSRTVIFPTSFTVPPYVSTTHGPASGDSASFSCSFTGLSASGVTIHPRYITTGLVGNAAEGGHIIAIGY